MAQNTYNIPNSDIVPKPNRSYYILAGGTYTGAAMGDSKYTMMTSDALAGDCINELVFGKMDDDMTMNTVIYNDSANFGGQTTPATAWLSPAQDDSWAPRYQSTAQYQVTKQVPNQQAPLMTHVYSTLSGEECIYRIAWVVDANRFVVWDPDQNANGTTYSGLVAICQNTNPATSVTVVIPATQNADIYSPLTGESETIYGPVTLNYSANQEGIVEPFFVLNNGGLTPITVLVNF